MTARGAHLIALSARVASLCSLEDLHVHSSLYLMSASKLTREQMVVRSEGRSRGRGRRSVHNHQSPLALQGGATGAHASSHDADFQRRHECSSATRSSEARSQFKSLSDSTGEIRLDPSGTFRVRASEERSHDYNKEVGCARSLASVYEGPACSLFSGQERAVGWSRIAKGVQRPCLQPKGPDATQLIVVAVAAAAAWATMGEASCPADPLAC